jgi:hypothetical protein
MRMAVQLSYGVVYACILAVGVPTVAIMPVGLTNYFCMTFPLFFSNFPYPTDDDDQARKR